MKAQFHTETAAARAAESTGATIRPFRIQVAEADLDDLRDRLARTRWPDELPDVGRDYGVPLDYIQGLTDYWRRDYDWRAHEARLNEFRQFTTSIDGEALHYLHVRSPEPRGPAASHHLRLAELDCGLLARHRTTDRPRPARRRPG